MKHLLLSALLVSAPFIAATVPVDIASHIIDNTPYHEGFNDGYHAGWCSNSPTPDFCLSPPAPIAPLPPVGRDNYEGGYGIGFKMGMEDKAERP